MLNIWLIIQFVCFCVIASVASFRIMRFQVAENAYKSLRQDIDRASPQKLTLYHYVVLFVVFSLIGLLAEEIFMALSYGRVESRAGLVFGPFSPLYGFAAMMMAGVLWHFRSASVKEIFFVALGLGAALEQTTGMVLDSLCHAQSWTYVGLPDAITQWVSLTSVVVWGVLGILFVRVVLPALIWLLGEPTHVAHAVVITFLVAFMSFDCILTAYSFYRVQESRAGFKPANPVDACIDAHLGEDYLTKHMQNLAIGRDLEPNQALQR